MTKLELEAVVKELRLKTERLTIALDEAKGLFAENKAVVNSLGAQIRSQKDIINQLIAVMAGKDPVRERGSDDAEKSPTVSGTPGGGIDARFYDVQKRDLV